MHHVPTYSSPLPPLPPPLPPSTNAPPLPPPVTTPLFSPPPPPPSTTPILPPLPPPIDQPRPPLPPDRCTPPPPPNQWRTSVPMPLPTATPLFQSDEGLSRYSNTYAHNHSLSEHQPISTGYYGNDAPPTYGNFEHNNQLHQVPRDTPTEVARPLFRSSSPLYQFHNPQHLNPRPHDFFEPDIDREGCQPIQGYRPFNEGGRGDVPEEYWGERSFKRYRPDPGEGHWSHDQSNIGYPPTEQNRMGGHIAPPIPGVPSPVIPCVRGPKDMVKRVVPAESIFDSPGRNTRPSHIVIILRGLPGSGKSHLAKLIKDKEASYSAPIPRILSIDTYFINEVDKVEKDRETGRRVKRKVEEYEYDQSLELLYRTSLLKQFNKTLSDGFFNMIIVDDVNNRISHFDQHWSNAKMKGYEAFVIELKENIETCVDRNIHNRTREEIQDLANKWEPTPPHFLQLDITSLLHPQDNSISEVDMEMEDSNSEGKPEEPDDRATTNVPNQPDLVKSRWEQDQSEDALDKLDGFAKRKRSRTIESNKEQGLTLKEYLDRKLQELTDGGNKPQKKRVRWADMEAAKEEQRQKEIGFTIGSKWNEVSEEEIERILNNETPN